MGIKGTIVLFFVLQFNFNSSFTIHRNGDSKLIVVSFDGFRGDYLSPSLTPVLWAMKENGVTGSMFPLFVSKTFPNHFSIATGLYEQSHGIVDNEMYDPELNEVFDKHNNDSKWWDNGYSLPLWIAAELSGRKSGVIMWPGCCTKYHGISATYMYNYNGSMSFEERADILFDWITRPNDPADLVFLYNNHPDSFSHVYGPYSDQVFNTIRAADKFVAYLVNGLKERDLLEETNIIFLSDHGMTQVSPLNTVNLTEVLEPRLFRAFGESQAIGILPEEGKLDQVYSMLKKNAPLNHYKVYLKSEVPQEYFYMNHRRIMPIIIEAEPGYEVTFSTWVHKTPTWGNHGNNNTHPDMKALFIGVGPDFKRGYELLERPFFNIDLYPIMAKIMNINTGTYQYNGTMELTKNFLC